MDRLCSVPEFDAEDQHPHSITNLLSVMGISRVSGTIHVLLFV